MQDEKSNVSKVKQTVRESKKKKPKDVCFVIMPFGGWGDDYYESIYRPAIESAGLEIHRADDLFRPSTIVNDIWTYTKRARLLLADLSGKNPNVFYELGLAHALAKPAILVAESMEEIPFDLRALRVITYDKHDPEWGRLLRDKVKTSIKEVLKSPLEAVLPAFLEAKGSPAKLQVTSHEKELIEIKQELDLLKREIRSSDRPYERSIDPRDVRSEIYYYIRHGTPPEVILDKYSQRGIPRSWIIKEINQIRHKRVKGKAL